MFKKIFQGKYGPDNLALALILAAGICFNIKYMWIIGVFLLGYAVFRMFSKDFSKRRGELDKFSNVLFKIIKNIKIFFRWIKNQYKFYKLRFQQRKEYVFLKCPKCNRSLRLPKNKGNLKVNCPGCKHEFYKKT